MCIERIRGRAGLSYNQQIIPDSYIKGTVPLILAANPSVHFYPIIPWEDN